ncbi:hypothetical protein L1049_028036 [Liquidambar formosana]|uniref:Serine/threonine-protein kinase 11-interacting protein n=1 Tax=Liquidambar formosana TaxID=63359 RepID=A0AAP0WWB5_LIQFO
MAIVTGDRYLEFLVKFVEEQAGPLIEGTLVLKLNPVGLHYVQSRLEAFAELESLLAGAPVDYLRAYISDLGDHRALEQVRRILRLLTSLKVVSVLPLPARDPTPLSLLPFGRLKVLELRGCDLSTSAARGLLELRHTLEKIICHDSTDALRHVFASRIAEIKKSPQWNRLQFVSCACNSLVLMDESLQLLPAVETLDLSRNKFAKVDNLRKCTKLKHLDLGFNHLRTIASLSEVSCHIVKLVLRNNALTTLRGIEKLKSLEGLDLSYNIISNFSELEILAGLPCLCSLWLEGNPLCCARWYRAQVFSFFTHPDVLKLDDKEISTREFWNRQIIVASRQKRPASFGFYSPAKDDAEGEGGINTKRKKFSRLASIESDEQSMHMCSDQESVSCDNEIRSREENVISDDEVEIVDLMKRVELMKKERSVLWLREFKEWMDQASENFVDSSKYSVAILDPGKENYMKNKTSQRHLGESSRYLSDSVQASGDDSSTNILESDNSFADISINLHAHQYLDQFSEAALKFSLEDTGGDSAPAIGRMDLKMEHLKSYSHEGINYMSFRAKNFNPPTVTSPRDLRMVADVCSIPSIAIDDIMESHSSSACPGSPPHYQVDILHRRHNLVEEILQLSAESFSVASSDSNTSDSEEDFSEYGPSIPEVVQSLDDEFLNRSVDGHSSKFLFEDKHYDPSHEALQVRENGRCLLDSHAEQVSNTLKLLKSDRSLHLCGDDYPADAHDVEIVHFSDQDSDYLDKKKCKRKPKKRVISLLEENNIVGKAKPSQKSNGNMDVCRDEREGKRVIDGSDFHEFNDQKQTRTNAIMDPLISDAVIVISGFTSPGTDDFVQNYFNLNVADSRVNETCRQFLRCDCIFEQESRCREVAVLLSSENKFYVLHFDVKFDGSGTILRLLGCYRVEDVREVLVGVGLQVVRVYIEKNATYLFITRSIEKSRQLLCALQVLDSHATSLHCSLRSLEQVQVELFEKKICGGLKTNIFQYSMVLFWHNNNEEESWLSRSLFVIGGHLVVCIEDFMQFSSLSVDASSSSYFSLDSCCSIADVSEMVIEARGSRCVTLVLECAMSDFCPSAKADKVKEVEALDEKGTSSRSLTWKLKWFSEESLFKFAALLRAIHAGTAVAPLLVRCIS